MKSKYSLFILLILCSSITNAQNKSFKIGLSIGYGNTNVKKHTILKSRYNPIQTGAISLIFSKSISDRFEIVYDGLFTIRGGQFYSNDITFKGEPIVLLDTVQLLNKNSFAYFDFPLLIQYKLISRPRISLWVGLGGYYSSQLFHKWYFELTDHFAFFEKGTIQTDNDKYDYGMIAKIEGRYKINNKFYFLSSFKFMRGFNNIINPFYKGIKSYHQLINFNLGLLMDITKFERHK